MLFSSHAQFWLWCAAVYNCLLDICARTNDQERGYDIIDRMSRARIVPNKYTLKAVKDRKALRSYLKRTLV